MAKVILEVNFADPATNLSAVDWGRIEGAISALPGITSARLLASYGTPARGIVERAQSLYEFDAAGDIVVDTDDYAMVDSSPEDGHWVAARVWVPKA